MVKNYKLGKILYKVLRYAELNSNVNLSEVFLTENEDFSCNLQFKQITFSEITDAYFIEYIDDYLEEKFNLPSYKTMYNYGTEIFALLHEIGHIANIGDPKTTMLPYYYKELSKAGFIGNEDNTPYTEFINYRNVPGEQLADKFAADFINKHYIDLCKIACDIDTDEEAEEILLQWA